MGKTSFIGALKSRLTDLGVIVDVDKITARNGGSVQEGRQASVRMMRECIAGGFDFSQEATLSGDITPALLQQIREAGYYIRLYYIALDTVEESKQRMNHCIAKGGHYATVRAEETDRCFAARWPTLREILPYCSEAAFYDNENGFAEVAICRNGELILEGDYRPEWILALSAYLENPTC